MFSCKQVSNALARGDYANLPWYSRLSLRLHVAGCTVCGRYNRQVMTFYDAVRRYLRTEDEADSAEASRQPGLSADARERMRQRMARTPPSA